MKITFVETSRFTARVHGRLSGESYRQFQLFLAKDPLAGDVIRDTGGVRKIRWEDESRGTGKRGGVRVIYYYFREDSAVVLPAVYGKDEKSDLTAYDRKVIRAYVEAEEKARAAARATASKRRR